MRIFHVTSEVTYFMGHAYCRKSRCTARSISLIAIKHIKITERDLGGSRMEVTRMNPFEKCARQQS